MNARSVTEAICKLRYQLDLANPEDCDYIFAQIDEQLDSLQAITPLPRATIQKTLNSLYQDWLDGKFPPPSAER